MNEKSIPFGTKVSGGFCMNVLYFIKLYSIIYLTGRESGAFVISYGGDNERMR